VSSEVRFTSEVCPIGQVMELLIISTTFGFAKNFTAALLQLHFMK
jgi:hypothetical protein